MTEPTLTQIAAFKSAWHEADNQGRAGDRVRDGLRAALALPAQRPTATSDATRRHNEGVQIEGGDAGARIAALTSELAYVRAQAVVIGRERDKLAAQVKRVLAARIAHPACDRHASDEPVSCGWKRVVLDIDAALDGAA